MPNEPEREIEKTLKAYARKRQAEAGAPRELHPATRRMLQAEAARVHAPGRGGGGLWARWLGQPWPQLALGVGAMAVLAVTGVILFMNMGKEANAPLELASAPASFARTRSAYEAPMPVAQPSEAKSKAPADLGLKRESEKKST